MVLINLLTRANSKMLKRIALIYFSVQFVSVSALGSIVLAETSSTPPREGGFCVGIAERLEKIDQRILEQRGDLAKEGRDRLPRLEEQWQKHMTDLEERRTQRDTNLDQHFGKLEERAKTEAQKQAVAAFRTAVMSAIDARRTAVKVALDAFHSGVKSILEVRKTAIEKAFADRVAAFKAAAEKAKSDCLAGIAPKTVRTAFTSSLKSAQGQFATARRVSDDFKKTLEKLKTDKKAAFEKAHSDFKVAIEKAKADLKKAFGESNATSTVTFTDSTAGWKIYTNEKLGYSFKYPSEAVLEERDGYPSVKWESGGFSVSKLMLRFEPNNHSRLIGTPYLSGHKWYTVAGGDGPCSWYDSIRDFNSTQLNVRASQCTDERGNLHQNIVKTDTEFRYQLLSTFTFTK